MPKIKKGIPIVSTLITLLAVVIMFALAYWQIQRANEKEERLDSIALAQSKETITLDKALALPDIRDIAVRLEAQVEAKRVFLLDNKINKGRVGYEVLVPINSAQGWLLANYGWLAIGESRQVLPQINIEGGTHTFSGILAKPLLNPMISETALSSDPWPKVVQQIDIPLLEELFAKPLLPLVLQLDSEDDSEFVREWQSVVMLPEKHWAYAIQWLALGLAALIIYALALRQRFKRENL